MKKFLTVLLLAMGAIAYGQIDIIWIAPDKTDGNYASGQDEHMVVKPTSTSADGLFLFMGGTGTKPWVYSVICEFAAEDLNFDVINLAYRNNVSTVSLADHTDSLAYNNYRQEVCFGTPLSDAVEVDTLNSIYRRTVKLIQYLDTVYPSDNWDQYLTDSNTLDWSNIVVGGHSQGAGHACYLAKFHWVKKVFMMSGPNDYSDFFSTSANWLRRSGITPVGQHYAYLSLLDEVLAFDKQLVNLAGIGMSPSDTAYADNQEAGYGGSHILYTTQPPGVVRLFHNSVILDTDINFDVWEYVLSETPSATHDLSYDIPFEVYPNPTRLDLHIRSSQNIFGKTFEVINVQGQKVLTGKISGESPYTIHLSLISEGTYFLKIEHGLQKIVKQ